MPLAAFACAGLFACCLRNRVSPIALGAWLLALATLALLQLAWSRYYRHRAGTPDRRPGIGFFLGGTALCGAAWGMGGALLLAGQPASLQMLLVLGAAVLGPAAVAAYAPLAFAPTAFLVPALSPIAGALGLDRQAGAPAVATGMLAYLLALLLLARYMRRLIDRTPDDGTGSPEPASDSGRGRRQVRTLERALQASEAQRLRAEQRARVFSRAPFEGIAVHDHGRLLDVNAVLAQMLAYPPDELIGKSVLELVDDGSRTTVRERLRALDDRPFEVHGRRRDGSTVALEVQGKSIVHEGGAARIVAVRDITRRKRTQAQLRSSESRLRAILENIQEAVYRTDTSGTITWVSPSCERLWGYRPEDVIGTALAAYYVDPDGRARFLAALEASGGVLSHYEAAMRRRDGRVAWVSTNAHYYRDARGEIAGIEGSVRDITDLAEARDALVAEKERALVTLASIGDGIITTDEHDRIEYMNPVAEQLTGWSVDRARGRPLARVYRILAGADTDVGGRVAASPGPAPAETAMLQVPAGGHAFVEQTATPIRARSGSARGRVIVFRDVTALRRMQRQLSYQASHDALTNLVNRYEFERRLNALLGTTRGDRGAHALFYIDLDQFKLVNDSCGHMAGDELLRQVAARLGRGIRASDTLARLGGDEFGVLLERCPLDKAEEIAAKLLAVLREVPFLWDGHAFEIGASIGVVAIGQTHSSLIDVLHAADGACYAAKKRGGNQVLAHRPREAPGRRAPQPAAEALRIRAALQHDRLSLQVQRAVPLQDPGARPYWQVLPSIPADDGEPIPVDRLSFLAGRHRLLPRLELRILALLARREAGGPAAPLLAVALSHQSVSDRRFIDRATQVLRRGRLTPGTLCVEISERSVNADLDQARHAIDAFARLGCRICLRDFGNGLGSFSTLKSLPADFVKIDSGLVQDLASNPVDRGMFKALNDVGRLLGKRTIAEGVDEDAVLAALRGIGVDYAQGTRIARPGPFPNPGHPAAAPAAPDR